MSHSDPLSPFVLIGLNWMTSKPRAKVNSPPRFTDVFPDVQAAPASAAAATSEPRPSHRAHRIIGSSLVRRRPAEMDAPTRMLILQVAGATPVRDRRQLVRTPRAAARYSTVCA